MSYIMISINCIKIVDMVSEASPVGLCTSVVKSQVWPIAILFFLVEARSDHIKMRVFEL